jgi:hypothetical protein
LVDIQFLHDLAHDTADTADTEIIGIDVDAVNVQAAERQMTAIKRNLSQNLDRADGCLDMGEDDISASLFQNPDHQGAPNIYATCVVAARAAD